MDIGDVVNKIYEDGVDFCKGTISKGFLGGCCGYLVAHIQGSDKVLMAQVCAIYFLVDEIFRQCSDQKRSSPFYLLQNCLLGMTWTAVMYNLELIPYEVRWCLLLQ